MSQDKTEKPTKRKLRKAREKGQVAKSSFLAGAIVFTGTVMLIGGLHTLFAKRFQASLYVAFSLLGKPRIDGALQQVFTPLLLPMLCVLVGILIIAIAAHLFQTGWIWSIEQIRPKFRKKGKERRFFFPLLQLAVIGIAGYLALRIKMDPRLLFSSAAEQLAYLGKKLFTLAVEIGIFLLFLGLCDFFYQKWRYYKQMHMTKEEWKQEQRESEGDPLIKKHMRDKRD